MRKGSLARFGLSVLAALVLPACGPGKPGLLAMRRVIPSNLGRIARSFGGSARVSEAVDQTLLNAVIQQGVDREAATTAFTKYDQFSVRVKNLDYMTIVDFTLESGHPRLYMIDLNTGNVDALVVAHGVGSDPNNTGTPVRFSNIPNSLMSSLGSYLVSERFQSNYHGPALRLDGLESSNSLARARGILIHSASYVSEGSAKQGMSWGCMAVSLNWISRTLSRLANGSFLYAYGFASPSKDDDGIIRNIMTDPAFQWIDEGDGAPLQGAL